MKAESILCSMESDQYQELSVLCYASVINCWANVGEASRAEAILRRMIDKSDPESVLPSVLPNSHCFSGVMKAYIKSCYGDKDRRPVPSESVSEKCEELLHTMDDLYSSTSEEGVKANTVVYNTLLSAYSEEVTEFILNKKINERDNLYSNVLGRGRKVEAHKVVVDKAVAILNKMESGENRGFPKPDAYTYSTVFSLLSKCGDVKSANLAESYLPKVANNFDSPTYNSIISAWARTGTVEGAERASALLEQLEDALDRSIDLSTLPKHYGPNAVSYFTAISAWVKSCSLGDLGYAAMKAEDILSRMESKLQSSRFTREEKNERFKPNVIAYSSIIDLWSKSGSADASDHVENLLSRMESNDIKPNVFTYTSCLSTYARSDSEEGARKASTLLARMKKMYRDTGDESMKPTIVSYFSVIDGWARSGSNEAGVEAEYLLREVENLYLGGDFEMEPDVRVYARVIVAHHKSQRKGSDSKAINLLKRMEKFAITGDENMALAKPNVVCYNQLIGSYGRKGEPIAAFGILNQMDRFNTLVTDENDKVIADEHSFNSIIYALSRSNLKGKAQKAAKMLERLENSHIDGNWRSKASARSYNMVIATCSNSFKCSEREKAQALAIAVNVFQRLKSAPDLDPDRYTYISLLKTFGKLLPTTSQRRRKLVKQAFQDCCNDGLVDNSVLSNFLIAAPKELSRKLLGIAVLDTPRAENLPNQWTRNVPFHL